MSDFIEFTFELAQQLYDSQQLVDLDWAWQALGYSRKDSAKRTLSSYFELNFDYFVQRIGESLEALPNGVFHVEVENSKGGRPSDKIYLTVDCFKEMGMLARSEQGKLIRKYFLQCEAIAKKAVSLLPDILNRISALESIGRADACLSVIINSPRLGR